MHIASRISHKKLRFPAFAAALITAVLILAILIRSSSLLSGPMDSGSWELLRRYIVGAICLCLLMLVSLFSREQILRSTEKNINLDVTGVQNKRACQDKLRQLENSSTTSNCAVAVFDLNDLKKVNDGLGHDQGDLLIAGFASILQLSARDNCTLYRVGGDEFMMIIEGTSDAEVESILKNLAHSARQYNQGHALAISYAAGYALSTESHYYLMDELCKLADLRMYENKHEIKSKRSHAYTA